MTPLCKEIWLVHYQSTSDSDDIRVVEQDMQLFLLAVEGVVSSHMHDRVGGAYERNSSADFLTEDRSAKSSSRKRGSLPVASLRDATALSALSLLRDAMYTFALC